MADKRKKAPEEGPHGVDRWTSNGYGLIVNGKKAKPKKEAKGKKGRYEVIDEK